MDTFNYMSSLSLDVIVFLLIHQLSNRERMKLKTDGQNYETWFQSLCSFSAYFFRKYPETLKHNVGMLDFVVESLKNESFSELHLLSEILSTMTGISIKDNMTEYQIIGQAGGNLLRTQILDETAAQLKLKLKRPMEILNSSLLKNSYIENLLLLTVHQK